MSSAIHVEISIGDPDTCQIAPKSAGEKTISSVTKCPHPDEEGKVIQEFTLCRDSARSEFDNGTSPLDKNPRSEFTSSSKEISRITRTSPQPCVCETIERHGCPVRAITAVDGTLYVAFMTTDHEMLQEILSELTDSYDEIDVRRAIQSSESSDSEQLRIINVGTLTERQKEVLVTAHRMGYFEHPKEASATEVADNLGIVRSTFTEHLATAQRNLLEELIE